MYGIDTYDYIHDGMSIWSEYIPHISSVNIPLFGIRLDGIWDICSYYMFLIRLHVAI